MTQELLKLALEALEDACGECCNAEYNPCFQRKAITAIKKALAQPEQEPVAWWNDTGTHIDLNVSGRGTPLYTHPLQRTWVGLMRGVRVEGDTLVITVKGGNDVARELCGALIEEMNK